MAYCRNDGIFEVYMYKGFDDKFHFHLTRNGRGDIKQINFSIPNAIKALNKLERLRRQGYNIPDYAFSILKSEI